MQNFIEVKDKIKLLDDLAISSFCDNLIKITPSTRNNLILIANNFKLDAKFVDKIINIKKMDYKTKQKELKDFVKLNPHIRFNTIEDWKDSNKIKLTKALIVLEYMDQSIISSFIGNKSKKTYANQEVINDTSLSLKKFFSKEFKEYDTVFYKNLMELSDQIVNEGVNQDLMNNTVHELIQIVQSDVICRDKLNLNQLESYKNKINDIVNTRKQEEDFYKLFYKIRFAKLFKDPTNIALKCIAENTWGETRENYPWLTNLITFINNGSLESKVYLITYHNVSDVDEVTDETKKQIILETVSNMNLNLQNINEITNFIIHIGNFFKHTTYYKWYNKELNKLNIFDKYKNKSLDENLNDQINILNTNLENSLKLKTILMEYYNFIKKLF
jgi:hypothetical protein